MPTRTVQPVSNPYAGGAIVADFTPYLNLALQQKAKEEAKAAAAQKVYDDMMKDPNPNGIRQQDTKGFYDRTTQWRNFGIQNKELIKDPTKDGGKALSDFRRMTTEIAGYINQSKDAKERDKQFASIFSNPEISRRIRPSWMVQYDAFQKPIDLGGGGIIDAEGAFGAKPLDVEKTIKTITLGQQLDKKDIGTSAIEGEPLKIRRTFEYSYANPKKIADTAKALYQTDDSFQEAMDDLYSKEGAKVDTVKGVTQKQSPYMEDLGTDFEKMYGRPMKDASDLAAIWGYKRAGGGKKEDVIEDNKTAIMKAKEEAEARNIARRGEQARLTKGFTTEQVPFVESVEDVEELIKAPDTKDAQGNVNLLKAADILRTVAEATVGTTGQGTFMTPLPSSRSMKADIAANPQYQTIIKEGEDSIEQALPEADRKAYKNTITNPNITREQFAAIKADAYNKINEKNGISHRFTADKVRNQTPVFTRIIKNDGTVINSVLPLGTNEFRQTYGGAATEFKRKRKSKTSEFESSSQSQSQSAGGGEKVVAPNVKSTNFVQPVFKMK
jgi:hypothetical protein